MSTTRRYHAFMLRLWQEQSTSDGQWRLSLHDVQSGEQYGFRSLDELCAYLGYRMAGSDQDDHSIRIRDQ